jgi:hypothetical protein
MRDCEEGGPFSRASPPLDMHSPVIPPSSNFNISIARYPWEIPSSSEDSRHAKRRGGGGFPSDHGVCSSLLFPVRFPEELGNTVPY